MESSVRACRGPQVCLGRLLPRNLLPDRPRRNGRHVHRIHHLDDWKCQVWHGHSQARECPFGLCRRMAVLTPVSRRFASSSTRSSVLPSDGTISRLKDVSRSASRRTCGRSMESSPSSSLRSSRWEFHSSPSSLPLPSPSLSSRSPVSWSPSLEDSSRSSVRTLTRSGPKRLLTQTFSSPTDIHAQMSVKREMSKAKAPLFSHCTFALPHCS